MSRIPPRIATQLLQRLGPGNGALLGDLHEEYGGGRSRVWYWRQALTAIAITTWSDLRGHPVLAVRAIALGWLTLSIYVAVLAQVLNHEIGDRVFDWLIVGYGSRDLPMLWVTDYQFWILLWTSHLFSGWVIARSHRRATTGALIAFATLVMWWTSSQAIDRLGPVNPNWTPFSPTLFWIEAALAPILILTGGYLGAGRGRAPQITRRNNRETSTSRATPRRDSTHTG